MCVYLVIYIHTHIYICIYVSTLYVDVCIMVRYIHISCICVYMYVEMCIHVYVCLCLPMNYLHHASEYFRYRVLQLGLPEVATVHLTQGSQHNKKDSTRACMGRGLQIQAISYGPLVWALTFLKSSELWHPILKVVHKGTVMGL